MYNYDGDKQKRVVMMNKFLHAQPAWHQSYRIELHGCLPQFHIHKGSTYIIYGSTI